MREESQTCESFPCSPTLFHSILSGWHRIKWQPCKSSLWAWRMRGRLQVSVETCRAEGRQISLGKLCSRSLGHFWTEDNGPSCHRTFDLLYGTFNTHHWDPEISHVDNVSIQSMTLESNSWACLSSVQSCWTFWYFGSMWAPAGNILKKPDTQLTLRTTKSFSLH